MSRLALIPLLVIVTLPLTVAAAPPRLKIITTVAPITNIVKNIAGLNADVVGVVPDGTDSHTFEPAPSDAKVLHAADLIIVNGLHLELPTLKLAEKVKRKEVEIVSLGERTINQAEWKFDFSFPQSSGHPNPHLWPNMALSMRYAELTRDALVKLDPAHKAEYEKNTKDYLAKLKGLDDAIFACVKTIPAQNRKLVTYHDSFAYFAPRYGMTVIAAVQPADFSEPSPKDVVRIIQQLRREKVPAVFGSEVFPSRVLEQIARESGAKFIDQLSDDELPGKPTDANHSFIGMMAKNVSVLTQALGGQPNCTAQVDTKNLYTVK